MEELKFIGDKEENKQLMSEEEFKKNLKKQRQKFEEDVANGVLFLKDYTCVNKFKSVKRAIRRGKMSIFGDIYPKRPFTNAKNKCKRIKRKFKTINEIKKKVYGELRKTNLARV